MSPKEQEGLFQYYMNLWVETGLKKYWDQMFLRVIECCRAIAIKKAPGKRLLDERSLSAACIVMDRIERLKVRPNKLSSYCYWPVIECIQGKKAMYEDQELQIHEEYKETMINEEIRGICRRELMNTED